MIRLPRGPCSSNPQRRTAGRGGRRGAGRQGFWADMSLREDEALSTAELMAAQPSSGLRVRAVHSHVVREEVSRYT